MMTDLIEQRCNRQIAIWLIICAAVIFAMVILGGVTRLTHSGLSMVDWKPLMGVIPPLSDTDWQDTFSRYQQFPEYQKINKGMTLNEFKSIFLFEYAHRILGRLISLMFLFPFLYFLFRGYIKRQLVPKLAIMFIMGGLQGLLGWYMVMSGLVDNPHVSQYRLAAHLGAAVIIYAYMLWVAFGLLLPNVNINFREKQAGQKAFAFTITGLLFFMILSGALVAGTHAGLAYNTFPLMGDSFIPASLYATGWMAMFEDITTIQFNHRMFAYLLFILIVSFSVISLRHGVTVKRRVAIYSLLALLIIQLSLGITTLLYHVPVALAAAHQGGAILLFTSSLYVSHNLQSQG